jgi:hypothetical protein
MARVRRRRGDNSRGGSNSLAARCNDDKGEGAVPRYNISVVGESDFSGRKGDVDLTARMIDEAVAVAISMNAVEKDGSAANSVGGALVDGALVDGVLVDATMGLIAGPFAAAAGNEAAASDDAAATAGDDEAPDGIPQKKDVGAEVEGWTSLGNDGCQPNGTDLAAFFLSLEK